MKPRRMILSVPSLLLALVVGYTLPSSAARAEGERHWQFFFNASVIESSGSELDVNSGASRVRVATDAGGGFGAGARYHFRPQMDVELALLHGTSFGIDVTVSGPSFIGLNVDALAFDAVTAGVNFHLTPQRRADLYVGPLVGYMDYQDLSGAINVNFAGFGVDLSEIALPFGLDLQNFLPPGFLGADPVVVPISEIRLDSEFVIGAVIGVDVPMGKGNWAFNAHARYLHASAKPDLGVNGLDLDFQPLLLGLGFGYSF